VFFGSLSITLKTIVKFGPICCTSVLARYDYYSHLLDECLDNNSRLTSQQKCKHKITHWDSKNSSRLLLHIFARPVFSRMLGTTFGSPYWSTRSETRVSEQIRTSRLPTRNIVTRQALHVWRNIEAYSSNHCCLGESINIIRSEGVCTSRLQQAKRMRVSHFRLWPVQFNLIYPHNLTNGTNFGKKVTRNKMCVFIFSISFVWHISHSKKISVRYYRKCTGVFKLGAHYSCHIIISIQIPQQSFEKYSNTKFHEVRSCGRSHVLYKRTDRQNKALSRFSQFCKCA
jgi:hypothetical protein